MDILTAEFSEGYILKPYNLPRRPVDIEGNA
jgi:hypothetical protein